MLLWGKPIFNSTQVIPVAKKLNSILNTHAPYIPPAKVLQVNTLLEVK